MLLSLSPTFLFQKGCVLMQDLIAGACQQADPDIDQVPFTFPPVHGPTKMGRGKRAKRGIFTDTGAPRHNGGQAARGRGHSAPCKANAQTSQALQA